MTLDLACEVGLERVEGVRFTFAFPPKSQGQSERTPRVWFCRHGSPCLMLPTHRDACSHVPLRSLPIHPPLSPWLGPLGLQHNPSLRAPTQPGRHDRSNSSQRAAHHLRPTALESWTLTQAPHIHTHTRKLITTQVPTHTPARSPTRPILGGRIHPQPLLSSDGQRKDHQLPAAPGSPRRPAQSRRASHLPGPPHPPSLTGSRTDPGCPACPPPCLTGCQAPLCPSWAPIGCPSPSRGGLWDAGLPGKGPKMAAKISTTASPSLH